MVDTNVTFDELFSACAMPEIPKAKQVRVTYNPKPAVTSAAQASYVSAKQILSSRPRKKYSKSSAHTEKNIKTAASRREEQRQKVWWEGGIKGRAGPYQEIIPFSRVQDKLMEHAWDPRFHARPDAVLKPLKSGRPNSNNADKYELPTSLI